ncbi:MAG: hypothetical protein ACD_60C00160G0007 [uncultured bacterium]|nr:MAG: hypothetical protein ACD_60C00160G0007 [uncultured bacterium]
MITIRDNIFSIKNKIEDYESRYHRAPHSVTLLAASKGQSIEKIKEAVLAGQTAFGENYVQEALPKIEELAKANLGWHFIGPIQRNKTKKIAEYFSWVQSVDNIEIAKRLNNQRPSHLPALNICLQINVSDEKTKAGIPPSEALSLATDCASLPNLTLRGLMCIPEPKNSFSAQKAELHKLRIIFDNLNKNGFKLDTLSMGMSDDMEAAVAEGATLVRIGTAIFGQRI